MIAVEHTFTKSTVKSLEHKSSLHSDSSKAISVDTTHFPLSRDGNYELLKRSQGFE